MQACSKLNEENREQITSVIKDYMNDEGYILSTETKSRFSLDSFVYKYVNAGGNQDSIKIEINYSLRSHIFEPIATKVIPEIFDNGEEIRILQPIEIFAAKANALMSRAAVRDLYDFGNLIRHYLFYDSRDLFRKCIIFYTTISQEMNKIVSFINQYYLANHSHEELVGHSIIIFSVSKFCDICSK